MNSRNVVRCSRGLAAGLVLVAATLSAVTVGGCGSHDAVTGADSPPAVVRIPDVVDETSRMRSYLYHPDNPFTVATVGRLLDRSDVNATIAAFEERGMQLSPSDCLVIEGTDDDGLTRVTLIGMTPRNPRLDEFGVVACFERDGRTVIAPGVFASTPARRSGQYLKLADDMWMDTNPLTLPNPSSEETTRWDPDQWNQFWECVLTYAPGPATACFAGCFFTGPGYLQCSIACVTTQALSVVVRCVARVLVSGRSGDNDRTVE